MTDEDRPNTETNPHPFDYHAALLTEWGHAALWVVNDEPEIVFTIGGFEGGKEVTRQIAYKVEEWEAQTAMVERMRKRSGWPG